MIDQQAKEDARKENEKCCVASMIVLPIAIDQLAAEGLSADHFSVPEYREVVAVLFEMRAAGDERIDAVTVFTELTERKRGVSLETVTGLMNHIGHAGNARYYAEKVREAWLRRKLRNQLVRWSSELEDTDPAAMLSQIGEDACSLLMGHNTADGYADAQTVLAEYREAKESTTNRVPTGFPKLDRVLHGGFGDGELTIIGARTSVGKTALACNFAAHAARQDRAVYFASVEMMRHKIGGRIINAMDLGNIAVTESRFGNSKVFIDSKNKTLPRILAAIRNQINRHGKGLVIVDYVQLIGHNNSKKQRYELVGEVSTSLKMLSVDLGVPIIGLAQVGRDSTKAGRAPALHDLRESGSLEQDADAVLLLYRDPESDDTRDQPQEELTLEVAKNREGECGSIEILFDKPHMKMREVQVSSHYEAVVAGFNDPATDPYADPLVNGTSSP